MKQPGILVTARLAGQDKQWAKHSVDEIDGQRRRDRGGGVASGGDDAGTDQNAEVGLPAVFDGRSKSDRCAGAGVEVNTRLRGVEGVMTAHGGVALITVSGIEGEHPSASEAVFSGEIHEECAAGLGMPAEPGLSAIHADVLDSNFARDGL